MLAPRAEIVAAPSEAPSCDLRRILHRHHRCLENAERALASATSEAAHARLIEICAFHRLRIATLSARRETHS
jgi:hypothetical protein